jgi:hypothetical protein
MEKKKIVIFEDLDIDVVVRYDNLNREKYETFVYLNQSYFDEKELKKEGFKNIYQGFPKKLFSENYLKSELAQYLIDEKMLILNEENPIEADYYFSDGLEELCFEIAKQLPKEKFFIKSSDPIINMNAKEKGYNLLDLNNF